MKQTITRKGKFDAGHRVMHEAVKCFNIHGHCFDYELTFDYDEQKDIGYPLDFKEIKRVACSWIDDYLDHGFIANPHDEKIIHTCKELGSKLWVMSLNGGKFCNPTAENIAQEIAMAVSVLLPTNLGRYRATLTATGIISLRRIALHGARIDLMRLSYTEWQWEPLNTMNESLNQYTREHAIWPSLLFTDEEVAAVNWDAVFAQW